MTRGECMLWYFEEYIFIAALKMKVLKSEDHVVFPENVTVSVKKRVVTVTGPRGTLERNLQHISMDITVKKAERKVVCTMWLAKRKQIACIRTVLTTIRNLIKGVTEGYRYKLRFAYAHFPVNVSVEGQTVEIRNFLGEKIVRRVPVPEGVTIERTDPSKTKDELVLTGNDVLQVSQSSARVHQACLVKNKDIRKFLDGIYVQTKCTAAE
ncbi:60S ribosomal protein L9 [Perkinsela sp. CCAP 1560/4]|nr:60S ribosomal protein L9 [Perkinsela sp. CCAP 1560/4]|eukprot:KNH04974.1 60S ribosomal protein L9 [Perkinsela sp. CCAP 1560/4]